MKMKLAGFALLITVGGWLGSPTPVAASCVAPPQIEVAIEQADLVFVGTVRGVTDRDRTAKVEVSEVWQGPDLPAGVSVHGGPDEPNMITSVDRTFAAGTTYLFVLSASGGVLRDNACSATVEWHAGLTALRPADARPPAGEDEKQEAGLPLPAIGLGVAIAALALLSAVAFRGSRLAQPR